MKQKPDIKLIEKRAHWHERTAKFIKERDRIKENSIIFLGDSITEGYLKNPKKMQTYRKDNSARFKKRLCRTSA